MIIKEITKKEINTGTRINKYLAECGVCSRREADHLLDIGAVTVNGKQASMGMQVQDTDVVLVKGKPVKKTEKRILLAYYKPIGVTCTEKDPHASKCITDAINYPERITYAGRLDKDSEGLMLMTNDGNLIDQLMRGANRHEKEYVVKVNKELTTDFINKMSEGVFLKELKITTRKCSVRMDGKYTFHIVLTQGVNRQIRRMCESLGYRVISLKRVRIVNILLGKLSPGQWREVSEQEKKELFEAIGYTN